VVLVSYREKIRVGGSEIIFFLNIFFMFFSIISVTTDAILASARNHPEKIGSHGQSRNLVPRVCAYSGNEIVNRVEKIIGRQKKIGSVGNRNHRNFFFTPYYYRFPI
jgi:hypothetical protein